MKMYRRLLLLITGILCFEACCFSQGVSFKISQKLTDSVVIPFEYKQSAIYHQYTFNVLDSVIEIMRINDSVTISIDGYAHQDEGNDTISKYLSLNRALFVNKYILGHGIDSARILYIIAYGKSKQLYNGTINMGIGNCRAAIKINYPPPGKIAKDIDGDNIIDSLDTCPDEFGERSRLGCPDTAAIIVPFASQQASLHSLTYKVLDSIIAVLKRNPTYTISIEGHAHKSEGIRGFTEHLATERVQMVKQYLLSRYIAVTRIDSIKSMGTSRPITAGRNSQEKVRNSRAVLYINYH
ncbi:MAG: OmpA family protein [Ferruginibacter sp.]